MRRNYFGTPLQAWLRNLLQGLLIHITVIWRSLISCLMRQLHAPPQLHTKMQN